MSLGTYFITGTDTDVGKTLVACGLLAAAAKRGVPTLAIKPVAAGCESSGDGLRNDDAVQLLEQISVPLGYAEVNPVALQPAIAPHIAAQQEGLQLSLEVLIKHCDKVLENFNGFALIEGAGGWRLPLNDREYLSSLPKALNIPVILVVGMKLGCLNHALLSLEAIERDGVVIAGWVANRIDPAMSYFDENIETLRQRIGAPLLGVIPHMEDDKCGSGVAHFLAVDCLL